MRDFESNIAKTGLFSKKQKLLLAISGGVDSVVLAHILKKGGYHFSMAHCNFQLRGNESEADEKFCKDLAKKLKVTIFTQKFNTLDYCREQKLNIQLAARKLRYEWFSTLIQQHGFDRLLTAHHANDTIETLFINLLRGTGINGLKGIPEQSERLVRPLLKYKKEELENYAKKEKLAYRLDKSNLEDKYERNFIRLHILPALKKMNPGIEDTLLENMYHFRQEAAIVSDFLEIKASELVTRTHDFIFIDKQKLKREKYLDTILHHLLVGYGFNQTHEKNILRNLREDALPGKIFLSDHCQLTIDRNDLVISLNKKAPEIEIQIDSIEALQTCVDLKLKRIRKFTLPKQKELIVEESRLVFPLIVRSPRTGDKFKPFGMKGFKLLSDFFKDEKLNNFQKKNCKLLVNGNGEIIWVIGLRSDERYKVNKTGIPLLKISSID